MDNYIKVYNTGSNPYFIRFYDVRSGVKRSYPIEPNIAPYRILDQGYLMAECLDCCKKQPVKVYWNDESEMRSWCHVPKNKLLYIKDLGHIVTPWTFEYY
jgi:hypothetical protein